MNGFATIETLTMGLWQGGTSCPNNPMQIRMMLRMMKQNSPNDSFRAVDQDGRILDIEM